MNNSTNAILSLAFTAFVSSALFASGTVRTNPPGCDPAVEDCGCDKEQVSAECIKVRVDLGETTPWTGSLGCSLKIFADDDSPSIFTPESLHAVLGGYTFKRLGQKTMSDGVTPAEVVLSHPNGEAVHFVFANGESLARPDPGVHIKMDARLLMVDAEGWATTHDPVYYDLYVGDGTKRRFLATNATGALGALVSITDERGVVRTPADMGVDIIYDPDGVRQYLTPSRLANVTRTADFLGYDVAVYALQEPPQKDAATGLYLIPAGQTVEHVSVRRENGGKRAVVTIRKGDGDPLQYVFDYAMNEWSLTRPSGMQERKECIIADGRAAQITKTDVSSSGEVLAKKVKNYKWMSWGFAMTNRVEGFDGLTNVTEWTYCTSGNGKGQIKTEKRQSGLFTQYAYDSLDRVISETRSGPDMMTEMTTYDYTPVDPSDPVLPVDTRPRTVVKKLNNIECERTYYVYSPLTNIVERVGTQGAAYGGTNALRTITAFYPSAGGPGFVPAAAGFVSSIRHEDGKLDLCDYELASNLWVETITHLHEQSPAPVSGKTTRDITTTNRRGEVIEEKTEAFIDGIWYTIARNRMTYNAEGKRTSLENLAGQMTTTAWDCCHKVSEVQPDGSTTTWDYDAEGRMISSSRLIPLDMTNVTWLTTCYEYDDLGRQTATWKTNLAAQVGLPVTRTRYDQLGRTIARIDQLGNTTSTTYSPDGRTVSVHNPNTSTRITTRSANGDVLSITGTAVTPEFHAYGILPDGTRWSRTVQGETASSPRFTKRYENLLVQTIREERSGFQGAVLATTHTYDSLGRLVSSSADYEPTVEYAYDLLGNRIATTRVVGRAVSTKPPEWRKTETLSSFILDDSIVWLTQTNIVSCSDSAIAPLITSSARQLTGLTASLPAHSHSFDIRGNVTVHETLVDSALVTSRQTLPYATNKPLSISRYGVSLMDVSISAVTNTVAYDPLGRQIAQTDGRGNTKHAEYNTLGQRSASIDALGNRTAYAYDQFGNLASVINPLGHAIIYEYDIRGRKTYEGGATYPVRYTYDIFGNRTTMMTYRNESIGPDSGDLTTWLYDEGSGCMTNKVYADGKGPTYSYTPDEKLSSRIWARGIVTDYLYDSWGNLTNIVYSDNTPDVSRTYDVLGHQLEVHDAAGVTTFIYDSYGSLTDETVIRATVTNTIERYWDPYGRTVGYAMNDEQQTAIGYCPATGRIESMRILGATNAFHWSYIHGTDLKAQLQYPNGLTVNWQYDAVGQLLRVCNCTPTNIISQYDYEYDGVGCRITCLQSGSAFACDDTISYSYNSRFELTNATSRLVCGYNYSYQYDDIGNRLMASEKGANICYEANQLNQYYVVCTSENGSCINFLPTFDEDGNGSYIQTTTGDWFVSYDGENRPVVWVNGDCEIEMCYDSNGRRIAKDRALFVYDGFNMISRGDNNIIVWDPNEKSTGVPLVNLNNGNPHYNLFDGNRNVVAVVDATGTVLTTNSYSPFGDVCNSDVASEDGSRHLFSSEYLDDELAMVYYIYRHYDSRHGRWISRDRIGVIGGLNEVSYLNNNPICTTDYLGLSPANGLSYSVDEGTCTLNVTMNIAVYIFDKDSGSIETPSSDESFVWATNASDVTNDYFKKLKFKCVREGCSDTCPQGISLNFAMHPMKSTKEAIRVTAIRDPTQICSTSPNGDTMEVSMVSIALLPNTCGGKQRLFIHEVGHVLGLDHPGGPGNDPENYLADKDSLMGAGMEFRKEDFDSAFCSKIHLSKDGGDKWSAQ